MTSLLTGTGCRNWIWTGGETEGLHASLCRRERSIGGPGEGGRPQTQTFVAAWLAAGDWDGRSTNVHSRSAAVMDS